MQFSTNKGDKPEPIQTMFFPYRLDYKDPKWKEIQDYCKLQGVECFDVITDRKGCDYGPERSILLETEHIFGNQWNTTPDEYSEKGFRVFNWFKHYDVRTMAIGHYLLINEAMRKVCRLSHTCGYCGSQFYGEQHAGRFCGLCLDSEYLQEKDLNLLRLMPVSLQGSHKATRPELTSIEIAEIMPVYIEQQTEAKNSRAVKRREKQRTDLEHKYELEIMHAKTEHDGFLWLLDRNINIDNVIYYPHTSKFCFGWRGPLSKEVKSRMLDLLSEFPFDYEFHKDS